MSTNSQHPESIPAQPPLLINPDNFALGYALIDDLHAEFYGLLAGFATLADNDWPAALQALRTHLDEHFSAENELMQQFGPQAFGCHRTEHENVLKVVDEVLRRVSLGELSLGKNLVRELPVWFSHHVSTMDNVLVHSLREIGDQTQDHGAQPAHDCASHVCAPQADH